MVMKMSKRIESIKNIIYLIILWLTTYGISAVTSVYLSSDNWLFGVILVIPTLFIAMIAMISSYIYLKEVIK